jgi:hypothetical protein
MKEIGVMIRETVGEEELGMIKASMKETGRMINAKVLA